MSAGGEEFTNKLDKFLEKTLEGKAPVRRPNFLHGTFKEAANLIDNDKLFLLYVSGENIMSRKFEFRILTQEKIIELMVRFTHWNLRMFLLERQLLMLGTQRDIKRRDGYYEVAPTGNHTCGVHY